VCERRNAYRGDLMTLLSLLLSVAAFVYLAYAMLRPENF
jgi:K+-transporting ATPase KdpF subunit